MPGFKISDDPYSRPNSAVAALEEAVPGVFLASHGAGELDERDASAVLDAVARLGSGPALMEFVSGYVAATVSSWTPLAFRRLSSGLDSLEEGRGARPLGSAGFWWVFGRNVPSAKHVAEQHFGIVVDDALNTVFGGDAKTMSLATNVGARNIMNWSRGIRIPRDFELVLNVASSVGDPWSNWIIGAWLEGRFANRAYNYAQFDLEKPAEMRLAMLVHSVGEFLNQDLTRTRVEGVEYRLGDAAAYETLKGAAVLVSLAGTAGLSTAYAMQVVVDFYDSFAEDGGFEKFFVMEANALFDSQDALSPYAMEILGRYFIRKGEAKLGSYYLALAGDAWMRFDDEDAKNSAVAAYDLSASYYLKNSSGPNAASAAVLDPFLSGIVREKNNALGIGGGLVEAEMAGAENLAWSPDAGDDVALEEEEAAALDSVGLGESGNDGVMFVPKNELGPAWQIIKK